MRQIVLLRGINLGPRNRIAMPALREAFAKAGYDDVATYVQSGNVVVSSPAKPEKLARDAERLIADEFGLDVAVIVRTADELADVIERDPLGALVDNPKRYQVLFMNGELSDEVIAKLEADCLPSERFVVAGREVYAWTPDGVARSKLWTRLAGAKLGVAATARNWTTCTKLLELTRSC